VTDRPFTVPVHTKEMLGYEVGVGFINLVTMVQSPLLGGFEHPGNWGCIFKNQGYEIWVSFFIQPNLVARFTQNSEFKS